MENRCCIGLVEDDFHLLTILSAVQVRIGNLLAQSYEQTDEQFFVRRSEKPSRQKVFCFLCLDGADLDNPDFSSKFVGHPGIQYGEDHLRHLVPCRG